MGNFSRDTFDKLKHYVGVRLQQGVPIVDADWNELEDVRKYELQAFLKWFVGNGVPSGNDGFHIVSLPLPNDFRITGGDGSPEGAGRILVEGVDALIEDTLNYSAQPLYNNAALATTWSVDPLAPLTTPAANRQDTVYLDIWEREVDANEDDTLVNPAIGVETCVRLKREWVVRVAENATEPPATVPAGHVFYALARFVRVGGNAVIPSSRISDLRQSGLNLSDAINHLSLRDNPHNVTAAQIGAFAASDYEFSNRGVVDILFTQTNANGATQTINLGFEPKFVWAVSAMNASLAGQTHGVQGSGYADLRGSVVQRCSSVSLVRGSVAPFVRQSTTVHASLCRANFSDQVASPSRRGTLSTRITAVSGTGLTIQFLHASPSGTGTGAGTGVGSEPLPTFSINLYLLCLG